MYGVQEILIDRMYGVQEIKKNNSQINTALVEIMQCIEKPGKQKPMRMPSRLRIRISNFDGMR